MNDNERLTPEQRAQLERLRQHQERFSHSRMIAGLLPLDGVAVRPFDKRG
jgi:hypothetical protein